MCELALFRSGSRWVLLDEQANEIGAFASEPEAFAAAEDYAGRAPAPTYMMIGDEAGGWREALLSPAPPH